MEFIFAVFTCLVTLWICAKYMESNMLAMAVPSAIMFILRPLIEYITMRYLNFIASFYPSIMITNTEEDLEIFKAVVWAVSNSKIISGPSSRNFTCLKSCGRRSAYLAHHKNLTQFILSSGSYVIETEQGKKLKIYLSMNSPLNSTVNNTHPLDKVQENIIRISHWSLKNNLEDIHVFIENAKVKFEQTMTSNRFPFHMFSNQGGSDHHFTLKRSINTIFLPCNITQDILNMARNFESQKDIYEKMGLKHRMGFLFAGLPGTGKTTLAMILAQELNTQFMLFPACEFKSMSSFPFFFKDTLKIILIEDVDQLFDQNDEDSDSRIALSNLTNAVDGIGSPENVIFIFTTNRHENIPRSITRAGRVNKTIIFKEADTFQIENIVNHFYPNENQETKQKLIDAIPPHQYTIAYIEAHFLKHINDIEKALEDIHSIFYEYETNMTTSTSLKCKNE